MKTVYWPRVWSGDEILASNIWFCFNLKFVLDAQSAFLIPSTTGLCAPSNTHSLSWKSSATATGVAREELACRYEQTMTTDGSSIATVLPRPCCSLPPNWRSWPINPKLCQLFSPLWIKKGSCNGWFTDISTHLPPALFLQYVLEDWNQSVEWRRWRNRSTYLIALPFMGQMASVFQSLKR